MADQLETLFGETKTEETKPEPKEPAPAPEPAKAEEPIKQEPIKQEPSPAAPKTTDRTVDDIMQEVRGLKSAMHDEREKRQRAERERDEVRAQRQPEKIPSIQDDPEAYAAHVEGLVANAVINTRFENSEERALEKHGEEKVKAAMVWGLERARHSAVFQHEYLNQRHPIDWIVRQHTREEIDRDPDAYVRRRWAELNPQPGNGTAAPASPPAHPQPAAQPPQPSRSIASAPSAGGLQTQVAPANPMLERLFGKE